jgi:Ca-activated chloride channel family protein
VSILELFHESSRWVLLVLLVVPLLFWWAHVRRRPAAMTFSSVRSLGGADNTLRARLRWLIPILRALALILLIIALARPRQGKEQTRLPTQGIAIQMVVDRSGSMLAEDFEIGGRRANRLEAVQKVVRDFVLGEEDLPGRPDDLIGMVAFARYADDKCPLTLDHHYLIDILDRLESADRSEDGTSIGDAIGLGVERLRALDAQQARRGGEKVKSKIMILLTDGENNFGDLQPVQAAEVAATFGIKIYTIGAGTQGMAPMPGIDMFGRKVMQQVSVSIDEETLKKIAESDGRALLPCDGHRFAA